LPFSSQQPLLLWLQAAVQGEEPLPLLAPAGKEAKSLGQ
jgi:hypothetical protein